MPGRVGGSMVGRPTDSLRRQTSRPDRRAREMRNLRSWGDVRDGTLCHKLIRERRSHGGTCR